MTLVKLQIIAITPVEAFYKNRWLNGGILATCPRLALSVGICEGEGTQGLVD